MNVTDLKNAISEAKRFIGKAEMVLKNDPKETSYYFGSKHTASAKRASMDLTRSLAQLRSAL